jgi:RimJ/RimL family protein N-acetyltransferase
VTRVIEFETPRLRMRQWRDADREPFAAMNADPAVMDFFPSPKSRRSRAVMERIGMRNANQDFEHPGVREGHQLRLHCLYLLSRKHWSQKTA